MYVYLSLSLSLPLCLFFIELPIEIVDPAELNRFHTCPCAANVSILDPWNHHLPTFDPLDTNYQYTHHMSKYVDYLHTNILVQNTYMYSTYTCL